MAKRRLLPLFHDNGRGGVCLGVTSYLAKERKELKSKAKRKKKGTDAGKENIIG